MKYSEYAVIVVGSGIAGLYSALTLSKRLKSDEKILLITKSPLGESNSRYAQGGIAGVLSQNQNDSVDLHVKDTLIAGAGLSDENIVKKISETSETVINNLISNGLIFDKDENGNFTYSLAGAHSIKRVLHCLNDATGKEIINTLINVIKNSYNIEIREKSMAVELLTTSDNQCCGVIVFDNNTGEHEIVFSSNVVIATGGVGQLYKYTTNPYGATGDGIAIAYEAGAIVQDLEFIQFHPTSLVVNPNTRNRFLISEAVRGEGAKLVNSLHEEFMYKYSDKKELASRDIVTRAIFSEMKLQDSSNVYLDISNIGAESFSKRFPHIAKKCKVNKIDILQNLIPVAPAAHYIMGGIKAEIDGKTSVNGLYAIGEAASIGLHGANRLACNSLLECAVCAYLLGNNLEITKFDNSKISDKDIQNIIKIYSSKINDDIFDDKSSKEKLRDIMWNDVGIIRTKESLLDAKNKIEKLKKSFKHNVKCLTQGEYEYRNMLRLSELIIQSAIKREESRGSHYRADFPEQSNSAVHSIVCKSKM